MSARIEDGRQTSAHSQELLHLSQKSLVVQSVERTVAISLRAARRESVKFKTERVPVYLRKSVAQ